MPRLTRRIVDAAGKIVEEPAERPEFLHAVLCQVGLPRSRVPARTFERTSGAASLHLTAGLIADRIGQWKEAPLPYGTKPRLVLYHLCSEAIRSQSPEIALGGSIRSFLDRIGISIGGRAFSDFKRQMLALAACHMSIAYWDNNRIRQQRADPIHRFDAWFPNDPNQRTFWGDEIILGQEFFENLCEHAVPLDPRAIHALQHSSLALDIYTWLSHRLCRINKKSGVKLSWKNLKNQFGQEYRTSRDFKREFRSNLFKACAVYNHASLDIIPGGILLKPSSPPIARTSISLLSPRFTKNVHDK